jgi:hypothetical protein
LSSINFPPFSSTTPDFKVANSSLEPRRFWPSLHRLHNGWAPQIAASTPFCMHSMTSIVVALLPSFNLVNAGVDWGKKLDTK